MDGRSQSQSCRLLSIRPSSQSAVQSPTVQWAPLQLNGCTRVYIIALAHYAIGGVAAHRTCSRRCSRHYSNQGCKELWLPPSPLPGCPFSAPQFLLYEGDGICPPHPPGSSLGPPCGLTLQRHARGSWLAGGFQRAVVYVLFLSAAICLASGFPGMGTLHHRVLLRGPG